MRNQLLKTIALVTACLVAGAQAQAESSKAKDRSQNKDANSSSSSSNLESSSDTSAYGAGENSDLSGRRNASSRADNSRALSAGGRSPGHQTVRATQLTGTQIESASGETIGTINDVLLNPMSGKVDFAIIQLGSMAGSPSAASPSTSTPGSTISTMGSKLVPVPWRMLQASSVSAGSSTPGSSLTPGSMSSAQGRMTFTFQGDQAKLTSAPSFSQAQWPDVSQASWRQSVYSHYGVSGSSAVGGSEAPGSSISGSESDSSTEAPSDDNSDASTRPDSTRSSDSDYPTPSSINSKPRNSGKSGSSSGTL